VAYLHLWACSRTFCLTAMAVTRVQVWPLGYAMASDPQPDHSSTAPIAMIGGYSFSAPILHAASDLADCRKN